MISKNDAVVDTVMSARAQMLGDEFHPIQESRHLNESPSPAGVVVKFYALVMPPLTA